LCVLLACWTPPGPGLVLLLCWPQRPRSAVAPALRTRPCHTGTRARPRLSTPAIFHPMPTAARRPAAAGYRWPASHPVTPSARPGMTHREEQSMRRRIKSILPADSGSPFNRSSAGQRHTTSNRTNGHFGAMTSANVGYLPPAGPLRWRAQTPIIRSCVRLFLAAWLSTYQGVLGR
jgi:hypothetical protein